MTRLSIGGLYGRIGTVLLDEERVARRWRALWRGASVQALRCGSSPSRNGCAVLSVLLFRLGAGQAMPGGAEEGRIVLSRVALARPLGLGDEALASALGELRDWGFVGWRQSGRAPTEYRVFGKRVRAWTQGELAGPVGASLSPSGTETTGPLSPGNPDTSGGLSPGNPDTTRARGAPVVVVVGAVVVGAVFPLSQLELDDEIEACAQEIHLHGRQFAPKRYDEMRPFVLSGIRRHHMAFAMVETMDAPRPALRLTFVILRRLQREAREAGVPLPEYVPGGGPAELPLVLGDYRRGSA